MRHGLVPELLLRLLGRCLPKERLAQPELSHAQTEVSRARGRADIVVWGPDFTLVVENKVDAVEGRGPCDYCYRTFGGEGRPLFVLLTPQGRAPSSASGAARDACRALSYGQVRDDLALALEATEGRAPGVARGVAEACRETLTREFPPGTGEQGGARGPD